MTILNKQTLYYLSTPYLGQPWKQVRNDQFVWPQYERSPNNYYGFEFQNAAAFDIFPLDQLLSETQINEIHKGDATLVLSNTHEGYHFIVEQLYNNIIIKYNIPPKNVILISESADIAEHIRRISVQLNMEPMRSRWMRRFEQDVKNNREIMKNSGVDPATLENKVYEKKFLCFNRRWRAHRTALVALLHATDLLKHGYVSLAPSDDKRDWFSVVGRNKVMMETCPKAVELLKNIEEELITTFPPLYLDTEDLMTNQAKLSNNTNYLYMQSYFSVVTETFFFQKERPDEYGRFFSEKTFKPVAMRHPFIIASVPNFFDKFKELGYKSFHPWINEEYDKEGDDAIRMWKIIKEIERLCNLTPSELEIWLQEMKKICVHNYDVMMSKSQDTDYFTDL